MPSSTRMPPRNLPCRCRVRDDCREKQRSPTPIYDELAQLDELHQELISNPEKDIK
jgi:hypothetical protein